MNEKLFSRKGLRLKPLSEREHNLNFSTLKPLSYSGISINDDKSRTIAKNIVKAKKMNASIIFMAGGHFFRSDVQKYVIDLMERGYVSCLATNGSGMIHDFEYSLIGATTETVAKYISEGQFGLWTETGRLNDIINHSFRQDNSVGMGEAVGRAIFNEDFPHKEISLFAAGYRLNIPVTVHVGIGYDIIHEHPNCDGAATGALSYNDFLRFALVIQGLENGMILNFGSAVMGPEVFLKALSMARNIAHQHNEMINNFTTVVCDLHDLPEDYSHEPSKKNNEYYFRPWKTMLVRTTADGGKSLYIKGKHEQTIPDLWAAINQEEKKNE